MDHGTSDQVRFALPANGVRMGRLLQRPGRPTQKFAMRLNVQTDAPSFALPAGRRRLLSSLPVLPASRVLEGARWRVRGHQTVGQPLVDQRGVRGHGTQQHRKTSVQNLSYTVGGRRERACIYGSHFHDLTTLQVNFCSQRIPICHTAI